MTFETEQERKRWELGGEAERVFGQQTRVKARDYTIIVPRMPVNKVVGDTSEVIRGIYAQNPTWTGQIEITRVAYAAKAKSTTKAHAPLFIGVREPLQANLACQKGLICDGEYFDIEVFSEGCRVRRCFNCQRYASHMAKFCKAPTRCGHCAGVGHRTQSCPSIQDKAEARCVPCGGRKGHAAYSKECRT